MYLSTWQPTLKGSLGDGIIFPQIYSHESNFFKIRVHPYFLHITCLHSSLTRNERKHWLQRAAHKHYTDDRWEMLVAGTTQMGNASVVMAERDGRWGLGDGCPYYHGQHPSKTIIQKHCSRFKEAGLVFFSQ